VESPEVVPAPEEAALIAVAEDKPAHQDPQEIQADLEITEPPEAQATQDVHPLKFANKQPHHLAILAQPAHQDPQALQELPEMPVKMVSQVTEEVPHNQDRQDHQDLPAHQEPQETPAHQVNQVLQHRAKMPDQDNQDPPETLDHQDHQDQQVNQDNQGVQEPQAPRDQMDSQVALAMTDNQDILAKPDNQEAPVKRVFARNTARLMEECSSRTAHDAVKWPLIPSSGDLHPIETCPMNSPFLIFLVDQKTAIYYVFL